MGDYGFKIRADRGGNRTSYFQHDDRGSNGYRGGRGGRKNRQWLNDSFRRDAPRVRSDGDGDVTMRGEEEQGAGRYVPYNRKHNYKNKRKGNRGVAYESEQIVGRQMWYSVTVSYGKKMDKAYILSAIAENCNMPINAFNFHNKNQDAIFYIDDYHVSEAIRKTSSRISTPTGQKSQVFVNGFNGAPPTIMNDGVVKEVTLCLSRRFNVDTLVLDLTNFHRDEGLRAAGIHAPIVRGQVISAVIKIIKENIPQLVALNLSSNQIVVLSCFQPLVGKCPNLKSLHLGQNRIRDMGELDLLKGLALEELYLDENPVCDTFGSNKERYISAARQRFPRLLKLDGVVLPLPIGFDLDTDTTTSVPASLGSFFLNEGVRELVKKFVEQYYAVYDSGSRRELLDAYHDQAVFSLSFAKLHNDVALKEHSYDNRNLMRVTGDRREKMMRQGKLAVLAALEDLPPTKHDINSFLLDTTVATDRLIAFTVQGIFKEVGRVGKGRNSVIAFYRSFLMVPVNSGYCIINDCLYVNNATVDQIGAAFRQVVVEPDLSLLRIENPAVLETPTPAHTPTPVPDQQQQEQMVIVLSQQTRMIEEWSLKCLQECGWDYDKALNSFTLFRNAGQIPPEAFKPMV